MPARAFLLLAGTCLLAAFALACPSLTEAPGDVLLGDFDFEAVPLEDSCVFAQGFPSHFTGTVSLDSRTGKAFLSADELVHEGAFQGGWMTVEATASRTLPAGCRASAPSYRQPKLSVVETVEARLYPEAEARELSGCTWPVERPDAGSPGWAPSVLMDGGVDVRLICGTIRDRFVPDSDPASTCDTGADASVALAPCEALFTLSGRRH